jgi:hypothetical protein
MTFSSSLSVLSGFVVLYMVCLFNTSWQSQSLLISIFKGTVRPDWICMRVVSLDRRTSTAILVCFLFFYFTFEYLKRLQSSEPLQTKMNPTSRLFGSRFVLNPFFLLAGAFLFYEKICISVVLFWFGLQNVRVSSNILFTSRNPKTNC